jgi:diguanylate cyclase (GGDEF)-like protein
MGRHRAGALIACALPSVCLAQGGAAGVLGWWVALASVLGLGAVVLSLRRRATHLGDELALQRAALGSVSEAVIGLDAAHQVSFANNAALHLIGRGPDAVLGRSWLDVFRLLDPATHWPMTSDALLRGFTEGESSDTKALLVDANGIERVVEVKCACRLPGPERALRLITLQDVQVQHGTSMELFYQASHDALTGVLNRREFMKRLELLVDEPTEPGEQHIVLFIDLDRFKLINDGSGHIAGDEFLRQIVGVLREHVRESDVLARIGGDEFCVLLQACPIEQALRIANAIRLGAANFRFIWRDKVYSVSASIGLVLVDRNHATPEEILEQADRACYAAKEGGGDQVRVYQGSAQPSTGWLDFNIVETVHNALERQGFRLYRQRIVWLQGKEGTSTHFELLLRMVGPNGKMVPPMAFIPAAERHNMMQAVDRWVLRNAFPLVRRERSIVPGEAPVFSINLSAASINDPRFSSFVREQMVLHQVPPEGVCFEITETLAVANLAKAAELIHDLKAQGFRFALDDFGTGMCSFAYLKHLPVDYLKIDGAFVRDMSNQPIDFEIVSAINNIAHALGIKTVAEFVEDQHTLMCLREIGIDYAQGQAVGPPALLAL